MSDLIDRQAAIDATWEEPTYIDPINVLTEVRDRIKKLPSAEPERKQGKWIKTGEEEEWYGDIYKCSVCGYRLIDANEKYCPNCGTRMDKDE